MSVVVVASVANGRDTAGPWAVMSLADSSSAVALRHADSPGPRSSIGGLQPTVVNNVERIANLPWIIEHGGKAFADLGIGRSGGLRLVSVCGHVEKPGVYELPLTIAAAVAIGARRVVAHRGCSV